VSKPISVGDLVVIVKAHCDDSARDWLGRFRTVSAIHSGSNSKCAYCDRHVNHGGLIACFTEGRHHPIDYLKRIPPLSELEGEKHKEELTA
jgi:hypothetical protein